MLPPAGFRARLWLVGLAALALRVAYAIANRHHPVIGDALTFHLDAQHLADGHGFQQPFTGEPTAEHPPLHIVLLAGLDVLGANGYLAHRLALALVGTGTVVLVGLLGRALGGDRLGLAGAALAAADPSLWLADGSLMSETTYGFVLVAALLAAAAFARRAAMRRVLVLGAAIGLAALARGEALALLVLVLAPLALTRPVPWRRRAALLGAGVVAFAVVLAPWTIRNLRTFDRPVLVSTNADGVWIGANCHDTYYGPQLGSWLFSCYTPRPPGIDESVYFARERALGWRYLRHHASRVPVVLAARIGRLLDVYRPDQSVFLNAVEGRDARAVRVGIRVSWLLMLLAVAGAVLWRRRAALRWIVLAPVLLTFLVGLVNGSTRLRFTAEPSIALLAALALVVAGEALAARRSGRRLVAAAAEGRTG